MSYENKYYSFDATKTVRLLMESLGPAAIDTVADIFKANEYQLAKQLFCIGFESDMTSWCGWLADKRKEGVEFFHEAPFDDEGWLKIEDLEDAHEQYTITRDTIGKGIEIFIKNHSYHAADALTENDDAITGDVFIQCCVFGKVIYG